MITPQISSEYLEKQFHGVSLEFAGLDELGEGVPHHVDVLDALEDELGVGVEGLGLVALAAGTVGHGVDLRPGLHC